MAHLFLTGILHDLKAKAETFSSDAYRSKLDRRRLEANRNALGQRRRHRNSLAANALGVDSATAWAMFFDEFHFLAGARPNCPNLVIGILHHSGLLVETDQNTIGEFGQFGKFGKFILR